MGRKNESEASDANGLHSESFDDLDDPDAEMRMKKYGPPRVYEPHFHGPVLDRTLTDVLCLILFILAIIVWLAVGLIAGLEGNPSSLVMPTDSKGRTCGVDAEVREKPYLFYFNLVDCIQVETLTNLNCPTMQVCVAECPDYYYFPLSTIVLSVFDLICIDNVNMTEDLSMSERADLVNQQKCAPYYLASRPVYGRCVPEFLLTVDINSTEFDVQETIIDPLTQSNIFDSGVTVEIFKKAVSFVLNFGSVLQVVYDDFLNAWYIIIIGLLTGALLCFVWCYIMRYVAGIMVWGSILVLHVLLAGGIFFCWNEYTELEGIPGSTDDFSFTLSLDSYLRLQKTWLIAGIVFSVMLTILLLLMLCLCNRIRIAINLIEEASKAVSAFWSTLFWPIIPFCMQLCVTVLWCAIAVYLATSKEKTFVVNSAENATNVTFRNFEPCDVKTFDPQGTSTECMFNSYELPEYHNYMQFINVFCYLWVLNFIIGLNQVILAGVFATYFWTIDKKDLPKFPLLRSLIWTITYHTGSVAFGALIIAIVQLIRIFLEYIELQLKGRKNKVAKFILRCLKCIFWCLEKFLKFINKNAYIMIAIYGKNFCTSAQNAFFLLMRNIIRVAVVNKITDFLLFIGIAMVTTGVVVLSFFYFTFSAEYSLTAFVVAEYLPIPNVRYYWIIIIMIGLGTFVVAQIFFGVFNMAVDTLFLSFLEDLERHDGSPERPYYMNKDLMQIVGKKNRKRHEQW